MSDVDTQEFLCWEQGDVSTHKIVKINIPKVCCGIKLIKISCGANKPDELDMACDHCFTYKGLWTNYYVKKIHITSGQTIVSQDNIKYGYSCNKCKEYNQYAISNQDDGTFKCYSCRKIWS